MNFNVQIEEARVADLKEDQEDVRYITQEARAGLQFSLNKFGCVGFVVVNRADNMILAGNQRYRILREMGFDRIPVIFIDLSEKDKRLFSITLNNKEICGTWTDHLNVIIARLKAMDLSNFINLRLEQLLSDSNVLTEYLELKIKEKEIDESIPTQFKCPGCGYEW